VQRDLYRCCVTSLGRGRDRHHAAAQRHYPPKRPWKKPHAASSAEPALSFAPSAGILPRLRHRRVLAEH
jgi:hypothetical protein